MAKAGSFLRGLLLKLGLETSTARVSKAERPMSPIPVADGPSSSKVQDGKQVWIGLINQHLLEAEELYQERDRLKRHAHEVSGIAAWIPHQGGMSKVYEAIPPTTPGTTFVTKTSDERENLANGMVRSPAAGKANWLLVTKGPLLKRWMELLGRGAKAYGANNWTLALSATNLADRAKTKERYMESAARHFFQWLNGDRDEDHAAAVVFNLNGYEAMVETDPK